MDLELSQLDKVYLSDLANYNRTLNQRNRLLKDAYYRDDILDTLDVWDMQLVQYGEKDYSEKAPVYRGGQCDNRRHSHHKLTGGRGKNRPSYEPGCGALSLEAALEKNRERDIRMKEYLGEDLTGMISVLWQVGSTSADSDRRGSRGQSSTFAETV